MKQLFGIFSRFANIIVVAMFCSGLASCEVMQGVLEGMASYPPLTRHLLRLPPQQELVQDVGAQQIASHAMVRGRNTIMAQRAWPLMRNMFRIVAFVVALGVAAFVTAREAYKSCTVNNQ